MCFKFTTYYRTKNKKNLDIRPTLSQFISITTCHQPDLPTIITLSKLLSGHSNYCKAILWIWSIIGNFNNDAKASVPYNKLRNYVNSYKTDVY